MELSCPKPEKKKKKGLESALECCTHLDKISLTSEMTADQAVK